MESAAASFNWWMRVRIQIEKTFSGLLKDRKIAL